MPTQHAITKIERRNFGGYYYPVDEYGNVGIVEFDSDSDTWTIEITDPYNDIAWSVGNSEDFVCFDYLVLEAHIILHSTVNSETACCLDRFEYHVVSHIDAVDVAQTMVDNAIQWAVENEIEMDSEDWRENKKAYTFCVAIENELSRLKDPELL